MPISAKSRLHSTVAIVAILFVGAACGAPETKLTKQEEANFKGSRDMSAEAQQKMQEGLQRMAKFNEELAQKRASQNSSANPSAATGN